jgi:hypothetical protein
MSDWLTVLPNLSIGVVAVGALVYISVQFLDRLDKRSVAHEDAMRERESALRAVEKEIRIELVGALKESTHVIRENSRVMERVVEHMDKH